MENKQQDSYTCDAPIAAPEQDLFKRHPFAERVAQTIASRTDPSSLVIGIHAPWGSGKTSAMNLIEYSLTKRSNVVTVKFNPWMFKEEALLITDFFKTLANAIGAKAHGKARDVGTWLTEYATILLPVSATLGGMIQVEPSRALEALGRKLSAVDLEELKEKVEDALLAEQVRVVVFMDDIDRLESAEIQAVFRLVKLCADFRYTSYVLAFDYEHVSAALSQAQGSGDPSTGRVYLEKIVQVPLHLPRADPPELRQLCLTQVDRALAHGLISLDEQEARDFVTHFDNTLELFLLTPRLAKRYGNALAFSMPLLQNEANTVDLMLIEGIRVFIPELYELIRSNERLFTGRLGDGPSAETTEEEITDAISSALGGLTPRTKENVMALLGYLFPNVEAAVDSIDRGSDHIDNLTRGKRIGSPFYFMRYFTYSVSGRDVSDEAVRAIIADLESKSVLETTKSLLSLLNAQNSGKLVYKLRLHEDSLPSSAATALAQAVAALGANFPDPISWLRYDTPFAQAAILVSKLIERVARGESRKDMAAKLLSCAHPLSFGVEIFRWFTPRDDTPAEKRIFLDEQESELGRVLAERISEESVACNFIEEFPQRFRAILFHWKRYTSSATVASYISAKLREDPKIALAFIKGNTPRVMADASGTMRSSDFDDDAYKCVLSFCEGEILMDALRAVYPDIQSVATYPRSMANGDELLAWQFAYVYEAQKNPCGMPIPGETEHKPSEAERKEGVQSGQHISQQR